MFADYDELKAGIADFLIRDDLAAVIPTFIRLAESRLDRDLRHWRQERRVEVTLDGQYVALPEDYLQAISLRLLGAPMSAVTPASVDQMAAARAERNDRSGAPESYAVTGGELELYPTPDQDYEASLLYHARIPALSLSNTVNWLLTEAPDAYLYGALIHTAPYLKADARIQIWEALYKLSVDSLNTTSQAAKYGGTGLKMKTRRGAP
jgi:hypothetical protein